MKKTLFMLLLAVAGTASAQKPFKMQANLAKDLNITKYIIYLEDENGRINFDAPADSVEVKNNKFSFSKAITKPTMAAFYPGSEDQQEERMEMMLMPGEDLKLTVKKGEYTFAGSKFYQSMGKADEATTPLQNDLMAFYRHAIDKLQGMPEAEQQAASKLLQDTLTMKSNAAQKACDDYFNNHLNEEGTVLFLYEKVSGGLEDVYSKLSDNIKNGITGQYIANKLEIQKKLIAQREEEERKEQERLDALKGKPAPDFTLNDLEGNPLALSSLRGKYVIIDFWGSWCGWCIKGIPDMKKYYEKYSDKLEILGVDCNDSEDAWKGAVAKYELPWKHVYNPRNGTVTKEYGITGYPTKIIVDPEGNYNKVIIGEDPAFYTYLDELLGGN